MTAAETGMRHHLPVISVVIPVLHEEEGINEVIDHVRSLETGVSAEIIVVDGDPRGTTIAAVKDGSVRTARAEKGRGNQMNCGASQARGDILLFLHADTRLPDKALSLIETRIGEDRRIVAGAFDLGFATSRRVFRLTEAYVFLRTRITRIPFGDQAIFVRRDYFQKIGGFRPIPIMEDVELMRRIKSNGMAIAVIPEKTLTSIRRYAQEGLLFCTFRNWTLQVLYSVGVPPEKLAKWYR